ncbi:tyrosine-type recombinase/integrase [Polaribacter aestuariivivens]|uniref:tyrosine-type recombinase/integrase n=1 Tax=Polaribacter aestuariivivens TaxID=2304626 RepID=UPI003F495BDB
MPSIYEHLILKTKIEHDLEHDLEHNSIVSPQFTTPKIYIAKGDLSKRWYVYFSFRNPKTGKLERMTNVYGKVNLYKTKESRLSLLLKYKKNLLLLLKKGFNPFIDNTELNDQSNKPFTKEKTKDKKVILSTIDSAVKIAIKEAIRENMVPLQLRDTPLKISENKKNLETTKITNPINKKYTANINKKEMSFIKAFDLALSLKEKTVSIGTIKDYRRKVKLFIVWMKETHPTKKNINEISRKDLLDYFNEIVLKTSARNRNNYRTELASIFQVLKNNELITENFIHSIPVLKTKPQRNKTYTLKEQQKIFDYLEKEDQLLLLFIKFVSYSFIRPIEVCRLRIKDINLENRTIQFKAKNSPLKTKIIPAILFNDLPDLSKLDKMSFLFTPDKIGAFWDANETNRRDHFSKRFRSVVKDHFKLNIDYGIYSFRHTFISKLYRKLREKNSPFEAKSNLMLITGHSSMSSLDKYLREIDAELPEDYSKLFK